MFKIREQRKKKKNRTGHLTQKLMEVIMEPHEDRGHIRDTVMEDHLKCICTCLDYLLFMVAASDKERGAEMASACINWLIRTETEITGNTKEQIELALRKDMIRG